MNYAGGVAAIRSALIVLAIVASSHSVGAQQDDPAPLDAPDPANDCRGDSCRAQEQLSRAASLIQKSKNGFVASLLQLTQAIAGQSGDEGRSLVARIDATAAELARWDDAVDRYDAALLPAAASVDALVARAAVYLDRSRAAAALKELDAAARLAPGRADVFLLRALAHERLRQWADAVRAFERSSSISHDAGAIYGVAQNRIRLDDEAGATDALQEFSARAQIADGRRQSAAGGPFPRIELLRPVAGAAPVFAPALYAEAFASIAAGSYEAALEQFRDAASRDPLLASASDDELMTIVARAREGELAESIASLEAAVQTDRDTSERRRILGGLYFADDQFDRSIEHLATAVRLAPGDDRSRLALADAYVAAGRSDDAERVLRETLQTIPAAAQAGYRLGQLYQSLNRYAEALREFAAAAQSYPLIGHEHVYRIVGMLRLQEADISGALAAYQRQVALSPNDAEAHRVLGDVYARAGRYDEALAEFAAALLIQPRAANVHAARAQTYLSMANYADAERSARRAVELDATHVAARYALGTALARLGRMAEAAPELEVFQRLQSAAVAAEHRALELKLLQQTAWAHAERGSYDEAASLLEQALSHQPGSADAHLSLGVILKRGQRYREALASLIKAAELGTGPEVQRHLAEVYQALGRIEDARLAEDRYQRAKAERVRGERR